MIKEVSEGREASASGLIKEMDMLLEIVRKGDETDSDLNSSTYPSGKGTTYRMKICREGRTLYILLKSGGLSRCEFSSVPEISDCGGIRRNSIFARPRELRERIRNGCSELFEIDIPEKLADNIWKEQLRPLQWHLHPQDSSLLVHNDSESTSVDVRSRPEGDGLLTSMESVYWKSNMNTASQLERTNICSPQAGMISKICELCQNLSETNEILSSLLLDSAIYREWCACILIKCNQASKSAIATIGNAQQSFHAQEMKTAMKVLQRMAERRKVLNIFKAWRFGCMTDSDHQMASIGNNLQFNIG
jgi:hypothetical protein